MCFCNSGTGLHKTVSELSLIKLIAYDVKSLLFLIRDWKSAGPAGQSGHEAWCGGQKLWRGNPELFSLLQTLQIVSLQRAD